MTFHKAGQSEKGITAGVPRFQELINATKNPKNVNSKIYFNKGNDTIKNLRSLVGHSIVGFTIGDLCKDIKVNINKEEESWYKSFKVLYNDKFENYRCCITLFLKTDKLYEYKFTMEEIISRIEDEYNDIVCVFSPPSIGQIDVFVDISNITLPDNRILFIDTENAPQIYLEECVQPTLEKMVICGIPGISEIYYTQEENNEWIVETDGSNYKKILSHEDIDEFRTISNDVWDIYNVLGIEAAREFLIEEFMSIMEGINTCHTKLLIDRMTYSGTISSISRYTLKKDEAGPFAKSSFEESLDNFIRAAAQGDIEPTRGVSASIICGKRASIGTGMMGLRMDISRLPQAPIVLGEVKEIDEDE